jgi:hypothetical protein
MLHTILNVDVVKHVKIMSMNINAKHVVVRRNTNKKRQTNVMSVPKKELVKEIKQVVKNIPKRKRRNRKKRGDLSVPGLSSNVNARQVAMSSENAMSEDGKAWLMRYIDPCGEIDTPETSLKICDGAIPYSATPYQRFDGTIRFPFQSESSVDMTGRNYSMLVLQLPLFRNAKLVMANALGQEFGEDNANDLINVLNNVSATQMRYPNFVTGQLVDGDGAPLNYFTVIQSAGLDTIPPPGSNGISPVINQIRCTFDGLTIGHNAPALFNQATVNGLVINCQVTPTPIEDVAQDPSVYLHGYGNWNPLTNSPATGAAFVFSSLPDILSGSLVPFSGNSATFTANHLVRNKAGTIVVNIGDEYRYENTPAGTGHVIGLFNLTTVQNFSIVTTPSPLISSSSNLRLYFEPLATDPELNNINNSYAVITLPPLTQGDIAQNDPKADMFLMKDGGGCYQPINKFTPVFEPSNVDFSVIRFAGPNTDPERISADPSVGWQDAYDRNFGIGVINVQSMPYAAQPLFKFRRAHEIVPSTESFFGLFATGNSAKDDNTLQLADGIMNHRQHLYLASDNFLGTLGKIVTKAMSLFTVFETHAGTIRSCVDCAVSECKLALGSMQREFVRVV